MSTFKKGDELMLFKKDGSTWKSIAYATSHTLSITASTSSVASKDHGKWDGVEAQTISWEISSENLYTDAFEDLFDAMEARNPFMVFFNEKNETYGTADGGDARTTSTGTGTDYYTPKSGQDGFYGNVVITSLSLNANTGEAATASVTFTGTGELHKGTPSS